MRGDSQTPLDSSFSGRFKGMVRTEGSRIVSDHRNFYSWPSLGELAVGFAVAAPMANTRLDSDFREWYQRDVRQDWTDEEAKLWKFFGDGYMLIPVYATMAVVGQAYDDRPLIGAMGEFGDRASRSILVGAPPMLLMQTVTGGRRPSAENNSSKWDFFEAANGVSGHAFMGAVPFITAAKMSDNPWTKGCFYFCSTLPAWSRVNDDQHYLSQAMLGWWMAYVACQAVDGTQQLNQHISVSPMVSPEMTGIGLTYQH